MGVTHGVKPRDKDLRSVAKLAAKVMAVGAPVADHGELTRYLLDALGGYDGIAAIVREVATDSECPASVRLQAVRMAVDAIKFDTILNQQTPEDKLGGMSNDEIEKFILARIHKTYRLPENIVDVTPVARIDHASVDAECPTKTL